MKVMEVVRTCPMCGKDAHVILFGDEVSQYMEYYMYHNKPIEKLMSNTQTDVIEFLRGDFGETKNYCDKCMQKILYTKSSGRIKDGESGLKDYLGFTEVESEKQYWEIDKEMEQLIHMKNNDKLPTYSDVALKDKVPKNAKIVKELKHLAVYVI